MNPLVTIAIPTFERLNYLKEAVASALGQSYANVEILIGDDGQTEEIREWSESITKVEPRVKYQRNGQRRGLAGNWNALADAANGEFLVTIGDDDRLLPEFVGKLVSVIQPDADVAFANHYVIDSRGQRLEAESIQCTRTYRRHLLPAGELQSAAVAVWQNSVPMSAALIRTADVRRLRFKEDLNCPEIELFARMAQEGAHFVFVPDYLAEYRTHPQSATSKGLRSEKLAQHLMPIAVAPEVEKYKRQFLAALMVNAVSRCLQQGEREQARKLLRSKYYPRPSLKRHEEDAEAGIQFAAATGKRSGRKWLNDALRSGVQGVCASLPTFIGCPLYRLTLRVKSNVDL